MLDDLNKEIAKYNNLHRDDYGIFLTQEQKDVILDFTKKQLSLHNVGCSKRLNLVVFEDYTRCYKVSDKELEQLKKDGDIEKGDIVCKVEVIKEY